MWETRTTGWDTAVGLRYEGLGRHVKRAVDLVVSIVGLVVLALLLLAVVISLLSPAPSVFGQERVGRSGRTFRCWKFRTMHHDAEERLRRDPELWERYVANDFKLDCEDDPRVTRLGRFLLATSLDELPQLVNVLVGQMSLVGPRPVVVDELESYGPRDRRLPDGEAGHHRPLAGERVPCPGDLVPSVICHIRAARVEGPWFVRLRRQDAGAQALL